jgi:2'-5' RNA ligase
VTLRVFVGVRLPADLVEEFVALQRGLDGLGTIKWVEPLNLHLTLKFLGAVPAADLPLIRDGLATAAADAGPARLSVRRVTAFPGERAARILVVEMADPGDALARLHALIERHLTRAGLPPEERPFRVHLTLGRIKRGKLDARAALARLSPPETEWSVEAFELIESRLGPGGPTYATIETFPITRGSRISR